jgi:hypothetical protein
MFVFPAGIIFEKVPKNGNSEIETKCYIPSIITILVNQNHTSSWILRTKRLEIQAFYIFFEHCPFKIQIGDWDKFFIYPCHQFHFLSVAIHISFLNFLLKKYQEIINVPGPKLLPEPKSSNSKAQTMSAS